jgi:hypothetical protein
MTQGFVYFLGKYQVVQFKLQLLSDYLEKL